MFRHCKSAGHVLTQITLTVCFRLRSILPRWILYFRGFTMTYPRRDTIAAACRNWWCSCSNSWRLPSGSRCDVVPCHVGSVHCAVAFSFSPAEGSMRDGCVETLLYVGFKNMHVCCCSPFRRACSPRSQPSCCVTARPTARCTP